MGVDLGHAFLLGLAVAQRFVRSGCVRGPISASRGLPFLFTFAHGEGRKLADLRSAGPHLRARPRGSDLRAKSQ